MGIFRGKRISVTALSATLLVVASIAILLLAPTNAENAQNRLSVNFDLLPGVAVAATIILLQLFVIAAVTKPKSPDKIPIRESVQKPPKPKSPGRPKKAKSVHPPIPEKPSGKRKNEAKVSSPAEGIVTT
jgi:hypothetical protein